MSLMDRLRQPDYTGENRCLLCTVGNIGLAAVGSALAAIASVGLGAGLFVLSLAIIYIAFACVLYNVRRLVDLLVKLAIDGEHRTYKPLVDANQFQTVAKQWYGLDPPD